MPIRNGYRKGLHLVTCERCAATYYSDQVATEWNGALVCKGAGTRDCWEPRHIIDSFRSKPDDSSVENARPRSFTSFDGTNPFAISYAEGTYWFIGYTTP
jgi:hypothetical protein